MLTVIISVIMPNHHYILSVAPYSVFEFRPSFFFFFSISAIIIKYTLEITLAIPFFYRKVSSFYILSLNHSIPPYSVFRKDIRVVLDKSGYILLIFFNTPPTAYKGIKSNILCIVYARFLKISFLQSLSPTYTH